MVTGHKLPLVLLLIVGCGDDSAPPPGGESGSTGDDPSGTQASSGVDTSGSTDPGDDTSGSTGEPADPCAELGRSACQDTEGCMLVEPQKASDVGGCGVEPSLWHYCVGQGDPLPAGHRTTFYRELDGQQLYLAHRQGCMSLPGAPVGWTECTGAPEDPEPCRCLCVDGQCPWEQDALTLEACEQEQPCGEMVQQGVGDPLEPQAQCVLEAMRDRTPGFHELWVEGPWWGDYTRIYANGDEEVVVLDRFESDQCVHPLYGAWAETRRCALPAPEFFDGCLMLPGSLPEECTLTKHWFTECEPIEAACF